MYSSKMLLNAHYPGHIDVIRALVALRRPLSNSVGFQKTYCRYYNTKTDDVDLKNNFIIQKSTYGSVDGPRIFSKHKKTRYILKVHH